MSLHCPALLIVARTEAYAGPLAERLRERNVAAVYTGPDPEATLAGRSLAAELGAAAATVPGLDLGASGLPGSLEKAFARIADELHALADLHRGETVVVLADAETSADWMVFEAEIGDDGVRLVS